MKESRFEGIICKARSRVLAGEAQGGQGTTEYGIIIAVIAVIAIAALLLFKPQLERLWQDAIDSMSKTNGTNGGTSLHAPTE